MDFTEQEFEILIRDNSKTISEDINWIADKNHSHSFIFKKQITSNANYPIFVKGNFNILRGVLSYTIIHRSVGRIYGLDMGQNHRNPSNKKKVGRVHKYSWTELYRDGEAYCPTDITKPLNDVVGVWHEFCLEANINHNGAMIIPPINLQYNLF